MWNHDPLTIINQDLDPAMVNLIKGDKLKFKKSGMFIFGGMNQLREPQNSLWLVTPNYSKNQKYLTTNGNYRKLKKKSVLKYNVKKI